MPNSRASWVITGGARRQLAALSIDFDDFDWTTLEVKGKSKPQLSYGSLDIFSCVNKGKEYYIAATAPSFDIEKTPEGPCIVWGILPVGERDA